MTDEEWLELAVDVMSREMLRFLAKIIEVGTSGMRPDNGVLPEEMLPEPPIVTPPFQPLLLKIQGFHQPRSRGT